MAARICEPVWVTGCQSQSVHLENGDANDEDGISVDSDLPCDSISEHRWDSPDKREETSEGLSRIGHCPDDMVQDLYEPKHSMGENVIRCRRGAWLSGIGLADILLRRVAWKHFGLR